MVKRNLSIVSHVNFCFSTRACFKKNSSLHIWPKNFRTTFFRNFTPKSTILSIKNSDDFFLVITPFLRFSSLPHLTDCPALTPKFSPHEFLNNLCLGFYQNFTFFLENSDDLFLVIAPFFTIFCPSVFFSYFTLQMTPPIPILCTLYSILPFYTHPHAVFTFSAPCFVLS